jgi:hypothetical protein
MDSASAQAAPGLLTADCSSKLGVPVVFRQSHGIVGFLALVLFSLSGRTARAGDDPPGLVLWAWERPENLKFLAGSRTAVAFLASTIRLEGGGAEVCPRRQPLRVSPETPMLAVVRVERGRERPSSPTAGQRDAVVAAAMEAAGLPRVSELQLDWDAVTSERDAYTAILEQLRRRLPHLRLSISALASWCFGDPWISGLPIDDAVPMLFEMGADGPSIRRALERGLDFRLPLCRSSVGLSTRELPGRLPPERRLWLFHARPWTEAAFAEASREVSR